MIELLNNNMEVWYEGRMVHSHFKPKAWPDSQIKDLVQRYVESKMPQKVRERIMRQDGADKIALDTYFDTLVSTIEDALLAENKKHRGAMAYESMVIRKSELDVLLNGLPLQVEETYIDGDGAEQTHMIDNPLRVGYEVGHDRLDGLPLTVAEQQYDAQGEPTFLMQVTSPARTAAQAEYDTVIARIAMVESDADVMALVTARANQSI